MQATSEKAARRVPAGRAAERLRLTRRGRIVLIAGVAAIVLAVLWVGARQGAVATSGARDGAPASATRGRESVVVGPEDSLWSIAARSRPGEDPRVTVRRIIDVNGLEDAIVHPGQRIYLPAK